MLPGLTSAITGAVRGQIQFVGAVSVTGNWDANRDVSLSSLTGGISASVQTGDLILAAGGVGSAADETLSITDGSSAYTLIGSELYANSTDDTNLRVAYKVATGSDTLTRLVSGAASNKSAALIVFVFRGVDASPLDVAAVTATATGDADPDPPAITPQTAGAIIVVIGATGHSDGVQSFTTPSDLTNFVQVNSDDDNDITLGIGLKTDWVSGEFNPAIFNHSSADSGSTWAAMSIALRPA